MALVVVALLVVAALIAVPWATGVPSAGDVCNAGSLEQQHELEAEKARAARIALSGAVLAAIAGMFAFVSVVQKRPRGRRKAMFILGWIAMIVVVVGAIVALLAWAVLC